MIENGGYGQGSTNWQLVALCSFGITLLIMFILKWSDIIDF